MFSNKGLNTKSKGIKQSFILDFECIKSKHFAYLAFIAKNFMKSGKSMHICCCRHYSTAYIIF